MTNRTVRAEKRQRGATVVEFAFVFLLFLTMVVALMELGRGVWTYTTVAHAARQGARFAMIHGESNPGTAAQIKTVVTSNAVGLDPNRCAVNTTWNPKNERGGTVQVKVSYDFPLVTGSLVVARSSIPITATSQVVIAN